MRVHGNTKGESGFTLIEMMIVVAIFCVLTALSWSALSPTHHEYEVKGTATQLSLMFKTLRLRAISTGSVHALVVNFNDLNDFDMGGKAKARTNAWESFQGNLPIHSTGATLYGNETVYTGPPAERGTIDGAPSWGMPLQALTGVASRAEKMTPDQSAVDIFGMRDCTCTSNCGACPVPAQKTDQMWFVFYPNGSVRQKDAPNQTEYTIYLGMGRFYSNNYKYDSTVTTDAPANVQNRWKVMIHRNTGRVKLMKGWIDTDA
ncbi:MAG: prepilin-type N-terminal cleavage/methylation domain-containing protein [Deltaproteobacteria bacterium]|nr:prepilin-type N-terminal cleavage/methylation domain-containing protein [Deltaproteobacteria bacterium]